MTRRDDDLCLVLCLQYLFLAWLLCIVLVAAFGAVMVWILLTALGVVLVIVAVFWFICALAAQLDQQDEDSGIARRS